MSRRRTPRLAEPRACAHCLTPIADLPGRTVVADISGRLGYRVVLRWHYESNAACCADADPLCQRVADSANYADSDVRGDELLSGAIRELHDRVSFFGAAALRAVFDIRADYMLRTYTLRGPGLAWARPTRRLP